MRSLVLAGLAVLSIISALVLTPAVGATPGENPCGLAINLLCRFVPIAPDLDHDIDLTQPAGPDNPVPASLIPVPEPPLSADPLHP